MILIIQMFALACLFLAALNLWPQPRIVWGWAGMFLWLLSLMIGALELHAAR